VPGDDLIALARTSPPISHPAAPSRQLGTLSASDVEPAVLPRLGAGQGMLVLAKIKRVQPERRVGGALFAFEALPGARATEGATSARGPLARRWARDRLGDMIATAAIAMRSRPRDDLCLISPYTSLVAVGTDVSCRRGQAQRRDPGVGPAGMQWSTVKKAITVEQPPTAAGLTQPSARAGHRHRRNGQRARPVVVQPAPPPANARHRASAQPHPATPAQRSREGADSDEEPLTKASRKKDRPGDDDVSEDKAKKAEKPTRAR